MGIAEPVSRISESEYLAAERNASSKSEFFDGFVFAMAGGSLNHSLIAANLIRALGNGFVGGRCRTFTGDLRIKVEDTGLHTYPDATVVCGEPTRGGRDKDTITNPTLLVEVLSGSTEAYDRGEKFAHYRRLDSLQAYLLADQFRPRLELFVRTGDGFWQLSSAESLGNALVIPPVEITLSLAEVYRDVIFEPPPPRYN